MKPKVSSWLELVDRNDLYGSIKPAGISFRIADDVTGVLTIDSAKNAIIAANRNPAGAEWWIWIAGWFDDCPTNIEKHF